MSGERTTFFIISRKMKTQKIFTFFWASLAAAFFTGADAGTVVNGFADRGNFTAMDSSLVKSPEGGGEKIFVNSLKLKAGETKRVFSTRSGLLKAGKKYTAKLRYKMRSPDPAALANLKLHAPGAQRHLGASVGESFVKMPFEVPANNAKASVTLNVTGPVEASISAFEIEDGDGESLISAKSNGGEFKGNLEKLPTGSPEFSVELPKDGGITVNAADYGMNEQNEDCASALNKAIAACREKKASKLIIPKGTYKFFGKTPITVKNFTDFTIDGNGSTFIYRRDGGSVNMMVIDCLRTEVRNLSMDWDWQTEPLAAIVKAVGAKSDGNNSYADFEILEYDKYPLYGKNVRIANFQPWDGKARMIGIENVNGIGFGFQPDDKGPKVEWLSPNKIRVFSKHCEYCARNNIGRLYRMQHYYYGMGGFYLRDNKHFTMRNVNIYSCKGHGILCDGLEYWQLLNVNIYPRTGDPKRVISTTADHLHFARSRGYFKMEGCKFGLGSDDCMNIHDITSFGVKIGPRELLIKTNRVSVRKGDIVELRHGDFSPSGYKSEILKIEKDKDGKPHISFRDEIPEQKFDGFVLFSRNFNSSNAIIRNCKFIGNRARGLLILASNITIENTEFYHNEMGAIKFETGYTFNLWCEGLGVKNVVVRNCVFDSANYTGRKYQGKARDIFFGVYMRNDPSYEQTRYPIISDILFENNTFKNSFGLVALISSSGNITFRNNTFENTLKRAAEYPYRSAFYINNSSDIKIINNTWKASPLVPNPGVYYDADTVSGLVVEGNKVVSGAGENSN